MIERIIISGYRKFRGLTLEPNAGTNILVGDNEAGKSTLLEAIGLALTGRINGRWAQEELNPYWFNQSAVREYFEALGSDKPVTPPEILIELYLTNDDDAIQELRGVHNSLQEAVPGVRIRIAPSPDFKAEFAAYLAEDDRPDLLPVEYYDVEWLDFADGVLKRRPKALGLSVIDSRTIRSTSGVDYHTREMLADFIEVKERAAISVAHRRARHAITEGALGGVNARIAAEGAEIHDRRVGLQMDQSANASWEAGIVPQVDEIPFGMSGQGQQAAIKVALAMSKAAAHTAFVLIEEPENHLSHTSLIRLVERIEKLAGTRQVFLTTHSSFVLNRLGLDKLRLLHGGSAFAFAELTEGTVRYFQRLSGFDTLRLVLARTVVLVEGPSDEMLFDRAFRDKHGEQPGARGIDVISMQGVALGRSLELCAAIDRRVAALRDNDDREPDHWRAKVGKYLAPGHRELFIGPPAEGATLEPQVLNVNGDAAVRGILDYDGDLSTLDWMTNNKTEAALRISEAQTAITYPSYITDAIGFVE